PIDNIEFFYKYLLKNKLFRLAYRLLNYYDIKLNYLQIEPSMEAYTNNFKIINKMKEILLYYNNIDKYDKYDKYDKINKYDKYDKYIEEIGVLYDPINLTYINLSIDEFFY